MPIRIYHPRAIWLPAFVLLAACSTGAAPTQPPSPATPLPVAVTFFVPSPTPAPTAAPTSPPAPATPTALPTAPPLGQDVNPFTGLVPADPAVLDRRALLIKVANTDEVRPQSGLSGADVVFEHYAEGGITRFTALYLGNDVTKIGSVRSCRLIDIELPAILDAGLVCSGTSPGVKPRMRASWAFTNNLTMISDFGPFECPDCAMFRTADALPPHNLFANTANARRELATRGKNQRTAFASWRFDDAAPTIGRQAAQIDLPYSSGVVGWTFDAASSTYKRALQGQPQVDKLINKQISAANVILIFAPHITTDIQEDATGSMSIEIQLWGKGNVKIARDGRIVEGQWKRSTPTASLEFVDFDGRPIALKPGNSWAQLVPTDFKETVK